MIHPESRLRLHMTPPRDPMILDRARAALRTSFLAIRTPCLVALGLFHRRSARPPAPSRVSRVLLIRTDRIGDMVLTTQALGDLRAHFRKAEITVLAPKGPLSLLERHPAVDRLIPLEGSRLPNELVGRFDLAIDFTPDEDLRGALLARASRSRFSVGFSHFGRQAWFTLRGPRAERRRHILDLNRDLLASLGVPAVTRGPFLSVSPEERARAAALFARLGTGAPRVVVHPGGHYPSQRWAPERFAEIITSLTERTGAACLVVAGPREQDLAARICAASPDALSTGLLSVRDLMAVFASCDLFVGNNSGPLHIAAALGAPTVSVMGPSDPLRFAPRGPADRVLRRDLPCSPCQRARCWHHTCLRSIEPVDVLKEAEAAISSRPAKLEAL